MSGLSKSSLPVLPVLPGTPALAACHTDQNPLDEVDVTARMHCLEFDQTVERGMNMLRLRRPFLFLAVARGKRIPALILAMLSMPTLLHAQETPTQTDQLDEIVVTARFRPESAQNVGESIRAFDNQEMQDLGINSVETLAALTPGLSIQDRGPNRNEISIEGVGRSVFQQDRTLSMASVGLYLDDVPIDIPVGAQLDIPSFDL
ncbi:MAG TPA: Plug domain-containing protein, partial [Bryobacteraceae bacterium]|nr:Plug domain-containing protein [Bryobacteraceae bacterium]